MRVGKELRISTIYLKDHIKLKKKQDQVWSLQSFLERGTKDSEELEVGWFFGGRKEGEGKREAG